MHTSRSKFTPNTEEHVISAMRETAEKFFEACEGGKGWEGCQQYCRPGATFSAQAAALAGVNTLEVKHMTKIWTMRTA